MRILTVLILSMATLVGCGGSGSDSGSSSAAPSGNTVTNGGFSERPGTDEGNQTTGGSSNTGSTGGNSNSGTGSSGSGQTGSGSSDQTMADEMLAAVNAARAQARDCGGTWMPAVGPLTWDYALEQAAFVHSSNMSNYDFFNHTGLDGSTPSSRVSAQGYSWRTVGENIAAGQKSVSSVMQGWLDSPGHCKNIMNGSFTQMGAASVTNSGSTYGIYWTQVFAAPK
ncbi:CAP domain-containing protein [Photobacterium galatheae]|uniref:CAP domain-containing protein n=1 Tax=Photobacterium galatheae TaxID=1654360 RepID=UPI00202CE1C8|nr:CAP domain-containing protein [Photobacterium galatheae]MCM0148899.1 CAP domain-containing protein [Photobacterium galatheae]